MNANRPTTQRRRPFASLAAKFVTAVAILLTAGSVVGTGPTASAVADDDWLGVVNTYRAMSGLAPVAANPTWSSQGAAHSCWMLLNGIAHDETPGTPGYTVGGDLAGNNGNVAVSSSLAATARNHIDLWMTGPFHAIGILRHNLVASGYGGCVNTDPPTPWQSGGTLDVLRGLDTSKPRPTQPILFPGNGATVPLNRFITEYPNPMEMCGWTGNAGLPLIALMPSNVTSANATITGPNGPVSTCVLHAGNTSGIAGAILGGDNGVVVMPRDVLADGTYSVTVNSNGGNVTWSFNVDQTAQLSAPPSEPLPPPDVTETKPSGGEARFEPVAPFRKVDSRIGKQAVRLKAGQVTRIQITGESDHTAISANFVAVDADAHGYFTIYDCTTERPTVSSIGYGPAKAVANQSIIPLQQGALCVYSKASADILIDVNGYYSTSDGSGFVPANPSRLHDSRNSGGELVPGSTRTLAVAGVNPGAPAGVTAVALNVTAVDPASAGYIKVFPCGAPGAQEISTINFGAGDVIPNMVVTPVTADGTICISSIARTDVVVDLLGWFVDAGGKDFVALSPIRLLDSRSPFAELNPATAGKKVRGGTVVRLQVAGERGVPGDAVAASVNITATEPGADSFLTAFPCGVRPTASNVNIRSGEAATANGAMVQLSSTGELCLYAKNDVHVIVDINGIWR